MLNSPLPAWNLRRALHSVGQGESCYPWHPSAPRHDNRDGACLKIPPWGFFLTWTGGTTWKQPQLHYRFLSEGSEGAFQGTFLHQNERCLLTEMHVSKGIPRVSV